MDIVEKINYLLREKEITKKEFADRLQALEPRLKSTGNIPNIQTIYGYLSGKRELKVELIPYIAEVLGVSEQELFSSEVEFVTENNLRFSREVRRIIDLIPYAPRSLVETIIEVLEKHRKLTKNTLTQLRRNNPG
jgi:transcriptional regulator with XRE-family HTH domain